ncbi:MAG: hypothetical protein JO290_03785 [Sphingomonadaceae bacterium]|nr:hypothetical protein [Sphingomonadaceae bacterium]
MIRLLALAAAATALSAAPAAAAPEAARPAGPAFVRGTITAFTPAPPPIVRDAVTTLLPAEVTVKPAEGAPVTVLIAAGQRVLTASRADVAALTAGSYIGTVARPRRNHVLEASEVHVFAEPLRGTDEGQRPWEPTRATLTAGTLAQVGTIRHHAGRTLTIDWKGGSQQVVVPANAPVTTIAEGAMATLVPGARVIATGTRTPDGRVAAAQVIVGVGGAVPAM